MEMRPTASNNVHTDSQKKNQNKRVLHVLIAQTIHDRSRLKKVNQLRNHLWLSINSGEMIKTDF